MHMLTDVSCYAFDPTFILSLPSRMRPASTRRKTPSHGSYPPVCSASDRTWNGALRAQLHSTTQAKASDSSYVDGGNPDQNCTVAVSYSYHISIQPSMPFPQSYSTPSNSPSSTPVPGSDSVSA